MKLRYFFVLLGVLSCKTAFAESFDSVTVEKAMLLDRIQCARETTTPPSDGFGSLWGCYNREENVKLWINSKSSDPEHMKNIKFVVVNWYSKKMDITGRIWSGIISEEYGGADAEAIKNIFLSCPSNNNFTNGNLNILVKCTKGPRADEHMILVEPK